MSSASTTLSVSEVSPAPGFGYLASRSVSGYACALTAVEVERPPVTNREGCKESQTVLEFTTWASGSRRRTGRGYASKIHTAQRPSTRVDFNDLPKRRVLWLVRGIKDLLSTVEGRRVRALMKGHTHLLLLNLRDARLNPPSQVFSLSLQSTSPT